MKSLENKEINANQIYKLQTYTGKLRFGKDGFSFIVDSSNGPINKGEILYHEIELVLEKKTLGVIPNGILIKLKNNDEWRFVLGHRKDVISFLLSKMDV